MTIVCRNNNLESLVKAIPKVENTGRIDLDVLKKEYSQGVRRYADLRGSNDELALLKPSLKIQIRDYYNILVRNGLKDYAINEILICNFTIFSL